MSLLIIRARLALQPIEEHFTSRGWAVRWDMTRWQVPYLILREPSRGEPSAVFYNRDGYYLLPVFTPARNKTPQGELHPRWEMVAERIEELL